METIQREDNYPVDDERYYKHYSYVWLTPLRWIMLQTLWKLHQETSESE